MTTTEPGAPPRYRVGIVGLSWITTDPARAGSAPELGSAPPHSHLSSLAAIPAARVVAGCDIVADARERFVDTWEGVWPGLTTYDDYREMIDSEQLDIVCVATPDHLHGDVVRYAARTGVRGIFCEKPLSVSISDADAMIEAVDRQNVTVNVNHTRRWMPLYVATREAIRSGAIGRLSQVIAHFGGERAMLWRNHSHFLDMITYFAESTPLWVTGELEPGFEDYGTAYKGDGGRTPSLEPGINAYIAYENGVRGYLGGMKSGAQQISFQLIGSDGRVELNDQHASIIRQTDLGLATTPIVPAATRQGMLAAILDLIRAMETGEEPVCPPLEARKTVAVIEGILASHHAGNSRVELRQPLRTS